MKIISLYKAHPPFEDYKDGYGKTGVVSWDIDQNKIQCHVCGKWFRSITNSHLKKHDTNVWEYKTVVGLFGNTPLCIPDISEQKSKSAKENPKFIRQQKARMPEELLHGASKKEILQRPQFKNMRNTCDTQLKTRFEKIVKELGRVPKSSEVPFARTLSLRYGTYNQAVEAMGLIPSNPSTLRNKDLDQDTIVSAFREFRRIYNREVMYRDVVESRTPYSYDTLKWVLGKNPLTKIKQLAYAG